MKKLISTTLFTVLFSVISFSQNITEFENVTNLITEDFANAETAFPIVTVGNHFIIDNGDYLLKNNSENEHAIIASTTQQVSDFILKTAIKLGPYGDKRASCGVIIKSQTTGSGALIFEINRKGEYRIKELLVTNTYKYLSGKTSNDGWARSKIVKDEDEFNSIKILCKENVYDIYINNTFLTSLFSPSLNKGNMGIIIGRDAKSRIAYYYLSIPAETTNNLIEDHMNDFSVINLSNKIKQLESEILTIRNTNERLEKENTSLKNDNTLNQTKKDLQNSKNTVDSLNSVIESLNSEIDSKQNRIDNLVTLNKELNNTNNKIKEENSSLNSKLSSVQNNLSNTEDNLNSLKSKNSKLNTEVTKLKSKIISDESVEKKLNSKVSGLNTQITDLQSKLSSQKSSSTTSENDLKNKISDKTKEVNSLKTELTSMKKEISSLKNKYSSTNNLRTDNASLKSSLSETESTINSLNTQVSQLNKMVKELEKQRDDLTVSDNKKSEDITLLTSTVDELYIKVKNMKKVLIYKGFEEDEIDSENISATKVENNTTKQKTNKKKKEEVEGKNNQQNILEDVTYTVQIATYGVKVTLAKFKGLKDVYYYDSGNETYLYMSGKFNDSNSAVEHKNKLVEMGYKDAFVVKLNNK